MSTNKMQIQDEYNNIYHPETSADIVIYKNSNIAEEIELLSDSVLNNTNEFNNHNSDVNIHTTNAERIAWNNAKDKVDAIDDGTIKTNMNADMLDGKHADGTLATNEKVNLVTAINEVFTSVSNGKSAIANAVADKGGVADENMTFDELSQAINGIQTGINTDDATATSGDILADKTAYSQGKKIAGTIAKKEAATITPTTADQVIGSGVYLSGDQTIKGDPNLIAANIVQGKSIFGINGTATIESLGGAKSLFLGVVVPPDEESKTVTIPFDWSRMEFITAIGNGGSYLTNSKNYVNPNQGMYLSNKSSAKDWINSLLSINGNELTFYPYSPEKGNSTSFSCFIYADVRP